MRDLVAEAIDLHAAELPAAVTSERLSDLAKRWDRVAVSDAQHETYRRDQRALRFFANTLASVLDRLPDLEQQPAVLKALQGLRQEVTAASRKRAQ